MTDQQVLEIIEKISFLIEETGRLQDNPRRSRAANDRGRELGHILAVEFGRRHGWKLSDGTFTISALKNRKVHSSCRKYNPEEYFPHSYTDHGFFYRWPDRRAAAVCGHLYPPIPEDIQNWAAQNGLKVSFPTDYQSWYYPGWARLVVIERVTP